MSTTQLLTVDADSDVINISIGRKTLQNFLMDGPEWPFSEFTDKPLKIVDKELFFEELVDYLQEEAEDGQTPIHRAFTEALANLLESGSESIQLDEPEEDEFDLDHDEDVDQWD